MLVNIHFQKWLLQCQRQQWEADTLLTSCSFYRFTVKIVFLILVPDPLSLLYKRFVTVTFENVCWLAYETSSLYKNA